MSKPNQKYQIQGDNKIFGHKISQLTILKVLIPKIQFSGKTLLLDIFEFWRQKWKIFMKYQIFEFSCQQSRFSPKIGLYKH